jgi:hypothetical protein
MTYWEAVHDIPSTQDVSRAGASAVSSAEPEAISRLPLTALCAAATTAHISLAVDPSGNSPWLTR